MERLEEDGHREAKSDAGARSYFDINQLELACIHLALDGERVRVPAFVEIGGNEKTLREQKRNLEILCRKLKKEHRKGSLVGELRRIMRGERALSIRCFSPKYDS
ncbi:MAG: hypothetical protein AB1324_07970 [Candidatus Micrarchaeota archaeon]